MPTRIVEGQLPYTGGTGITKKGNVTEVYVGTTKVRPSSGQQQQSGGSGQGENNGGNR